MTLARRITGLQREPATPFVPTDLGSLTHWYDFSDISTLWKDTGRSSAVTADADIIKGVTNKASGATIHLSEATNGPQYKTAIRNGNSVARFNGTSDVLQTTATIGADASRTFLFVVHKNSAVGAGSHDAWALDPNAQFYTNSGSHASGWNYFGTQAGGEQLNVVPTATNWNIAVLRLNSNASLDIYANGGTPTNFDPDNGVSSDSVMALGSYYGLSVFADVDIAEAFVCSDALSATDLNSLGNYAGTKWSISWSNVS